MLSLELSSDKIDFPFTKWLKAIAGYGDHVGIRFVREINQSRAVRDGKPEENYIFYDQGAMIEVMIGGQIAYAGTADLSLSGIERAAKKAAFLARSAQPFSVFPFNQSHRPLAVGEYSSPRQKGLDQISLKEISDRLVKATQLMKVSDQIVSSTAQANFIESDFEYLSTAGTHTRQNFLFISSHFGVSAKNGTETVSRSLQGPRGLCVQSGLEAFEGFALEADLLRVGEEALALLQAENCPAQKCDLILTPSQMLLQIHESIGHPLELDRILGDERNFAGWSFVQPKDFGQLQYGSKLMNVSFDPHYQGEFASYAFDDCGHKASKEYLIKEGKLLRGLGSLESQARLGIPGVANFRAMSWYRPPIDRMANINLEPGDTRLSDMISQVENGILMDANISWSIDDYRNKFQFGCELGKIIKEGQIKGLVKFPNYRGITVAFWNQLKAVGTAAEMKAFGSPFCGKGEPSQIIRVGHASPPCLFSNVEVFGGGK